MPRYPGAQFKDVGAPANYSNGKMDSYRGIVLHVNDAMSDDLYGWITGNHNMSCHFQVNNEGHVYQYIDTLYSSWCQAAGNDDWLSIETEGKGGTPLTTAQLNSVAGIVKWAAATHGFPLDITNDPVNGRGLGWHGMGGGAWGNHPLCPGDARRAQMPDIIAKAKGVTNPLPPAPKPTSNLVKPVWPLPSGHYFGLISGPAQSHGGYYASERPYVQYIQKRMIQMGYAPNVAGWADGIYEQPTADAVARWQRAKYASVTSLYGQVWSDDWARL